MPKMQTVAWLLVGLAIANVADRMFGVSRLLSGTSAAA